MLILLLLIQCMLMLSVHAECPEVLECMRCTGEANCTLSADEKRIECEADDSIVCQQQTCSTPYFRCMASWRRSNPGDAWVLISSCISSGTADPCDVGEICSHQFGDTPPDSVAQGSFYCQCYGNFCNQNFLADINPTMIDPTVVIGSGNTTVMESSSIIESSILTPTPTSIIESSSILTPTPTVQVDERDCTQCTNVEANCSLTEDNRTLQCFFDDQCRNNIIRCGPRQRCTAIWSRGSSSTEWIASGTCFGDTDSANDPPTCQVAETYFTERSQTIPDSVETGGFICSCLGGLCNREFGIDLNDFTNSDTTTSMSPTPSSSTMGPTTSTMVSNTSTMVSNTSTMVPTMTTGGPVVVNPAAKVNTDGLSGNDIIAISVSLTLVFCLVVLAVLITGFCIFAHRSPRVGERDWDQSEGGFREVLAQLPVEPLEIVGSGRFGTVWKAKLHEEMVACKILSFKETKSWENERMLYCLSSTAHPNILEYIGSEQKGQGYEAQYLMVLKYCPLGSLTLYLKGHTLTWNQACNFINSALAGVAHLHAESYYNAEGSCEKKLPIAHRDIKSSNFLVKSDSGDCVLSDLGLSLQLDPNMDVSELASIGQVGTYRYMSPEALDASVNLQDLESFKQIDMYALALVLWEIASRCPAHEGEAVPEFSLPFSREVGERANPTLDTMRAVVVHGRKRPKIPETWKTHEGLSVLAETIPECWDQDPEARLTATGVLSRMEEALEIKGPDRQKIKQLRAQAKSTSSCESGSCEQTISSVSSKNCSSTEVTTEANEEANNTSNSSSGNSSDEVTVEASEVDTHYANRAEEVTVDASEVQ